jgi:hypothetical protein
MLLLLDTSSMSNRTITSRGEALVVGHLSHTNTFEVPLRRRTQSIRRHLTGLLAKHHHRVFVTVIDIRRDAERKGVNVSLKKTTS